MSTAELTIALQDIYPHLAQRDGNAQIYTDSLDTVLEQFGTHSGHIVMLPSLMELARLFQVSCMAAHDILQMLRTRGYDYQLNSMEQPIQFWYTACCDKKR